MTQKTPSAPAPELKPHKKTPPLKRTAATRRSTIGLKVSMAISGLIMVLYLLAHMYGNLKIFAGQKAFDAYAANLRTIGEPMLPHEGLLWIVRVVLLASLIIHVYSAVTLWKRAKQAAGGQGARRYQSRKAPRGVQRSYASFTMRYGGLIVLLFVIYHLLHLTGNQIAPGGASSSPFERVVNGFEIWWVVASYAIAMIAIGFHLQHGIWSAAATLGQNTSPERRKLLWRLSTGVALIIVIGFLIPPFSILFGWIS